MKTTVATVPIPVKYDENNGAIWSDEGGVTQVCFLIGGHANSLGPLPQELAAESRDWSVCIVDQVKSASTWTNRPALLPEVGHAVESRLLVEDVALCIHDDGAVDVVFNPVRSSEVVQGQVPVRPAHHVMVQVLVWSQSRQFNMKLELLLTLF